MAFCSSQRSISIHLRERTALERMRRRCATSGLVCAAVALMHAVDASTDIASPIAAGGGGADVTMNTTFCVRVPAPIAEREQWIPGMTTLQGDECPLQVEIPEGQVKVNVGETLTLTWSVRINRTRLPANALNHTQLPRTGANNTDIICARLRSCVSGVDCSPFANSSIIETRCQTGQFNNDVVAFEDQARYERAGNYKVVGQVVLPSSNPDEHFAYYSFQQIHVGEAGVASSQDHVLQPSMTRESGRDLSTRAIVGIVVGCCVGIIAIVAAWRIVQRQLRKQPAEEPDTELEEPRVSYNKVHESLPTASTFTIDRAQSLPQIHNNYSIFDDDDDGPVPFLGNRRTAPQLSTQTSTAAESVSSVDESDVIQQPVVLRTPPRELFNRELGSERMFEMTKSFEVVPIQPPSNRSRNIFQSTNSVDFVYPDTGRSMNVPDMDTQRFEDTNTTRRIFGSLVDFVEEGDEEAEADADERTGDVPTGETKAIDQTALLLSSVAPVEESETTATQSL